MKTFKSLYQLAAACLALAAGSISAAAAEVGKSAPEFSLTDINGQMIQLSDYAGKTVVLEWVNPECPFVKRHYESGNMPAVQKEATDQGVVWLSINSGSDGDQGGYDATQARQWMQRVGSAATAYVRDSGGKVTRLYNAKTTPHMFVIDPKGTLVYSGAIDSNRRSHEGAENYVLTTLAAIKEGKPVAKSTTTPYGCGVKL